MFWSYVRSIIMGITSRGRGAKIREVLKNEIFFNKYLNPVIRTIIKLLKIKISDNTAYRLPAIGTFCYKLPEGKKLYFTANGHDSIANIIYWKGLRRFEGETIDLFLKLAKKSRIIFDIGANTGIFALLSSIYYPEHTTYAFEPLPRVFDYLKKNMEINNLHNLKILPYAISNYNGKIKLYVTNSPIPSNSSTLKEFREFSEEIFVKAITLDNFKTEKKLSKIDLIKIDTEATEHLVFQGSKKVLKRDRPFIICEVLKGRTEKELHKIFNDYHYRYFLITTEGLREKNPIEGDGTYRFKNFLFVPSEKTNQAISISEGHKLVL